jgi:predicted nucleotidyltransferase
LSTADLPAQAVADVEATLDAVRREHQVHIPLAIESGSRAWGFPSPDSDYDCRFIFVRPADQHLTLWTPRDVIETPIQGELDVNGWELRKALRLLLKGNAVVVEWLRSPITYTADQTFRTELLDFAQQYADRARIASHYLHFGTRQRAVYLGDAQQVALKKLFYVLRPAAALRWMRLHPQHAIPPMHFPTLLAESDPPSDVQAVTADLLARKAVTREMGMGAAPPALLHLIDEELTAAVDWIGETSGPDAGVKRRADALYRDLTRRLDAGAA